MSKTLVTLTRETSDRIHNGRRAPGVLLAVMAEVGELAEEIGVEYGNSYKKAGPDGVVGEAIDAILALLDLITVHDPSLTEEQIMEMAKKKLKKWEDNVRAHTK